MGSGKKDKFKIPNYDNVLYLKNGYNKTLNYFKLFNLYNRYAEKAEKIIVHSFIRNRNLYYFYFNQKLLSKAYWVIWGSDLHIYSKTRNKLSEKIKHYIRTQVYKKVANYVVYTLGEYNLAQNWFGAKGKCFQCFVYPSNLYHHYEVKLQKSNKINILLGNSADPSNNHIYLFENLKRFKHEEIRIYVPLSYGSKEYAEEIILRGNELFGNKFIPMTQFMSFDNYLEFLSKIDIAIFGHSRQQAMGNIRTLLGLGKKVYMNKNLTTFKALKEMGIKVFHLESINLEKSFVESEKNIEVIKEKHSKEQLVKCLSNIFES